MPSKDPYNLHYLTYSDELTGPNQWNFDPLGATVIAIAKVAEGSPLHLRIPVCSPRSPLTGRYPVRRVQSGLWYISPVVYVDSGRKRIWLSSMQSFAPALHSTFLALTRTPEDVEMFFDLLENEVACGF